MKKRIVNAKIACLDMNLQKARMQLGVQILVDDPDQLEDIRKRYGHERSHYPFTSHSIFNLTQRIRNNPRANPQNPCLWRQRCPNHQRN